MKRPSHPADKIKAEPLKADKLVEDGFPLSDFLDIKEISYGEFREISDLNPRFRAGSRKVKVVLEVHAPEVDAGQADLSSVFAGLNHLLPSLERHQCGENLFDDLKSGKKGSFGEQLERITDIAHIMEHVIIDLQSKITGMNTCSGITCGYKEPNNRFDLFVECKDKRVGVLSAFFAADLLKRLLSGRGVSRRYFALIDLAKYIYGRDPQRPAAGVENLIPQISSEFGWRRAFVLPLLKTLDNCGFVTL